MKPMIFDYLIEEAALLGHTPEMVLARLRQKYRDDKEQGLHDLKANALELLQQAAQVEIDNWEYQNTEEETLEPRPPFPVELTSIDEAVFNIGFLGTYQELACFVVCEDGSDQYCLWSFALDSSFENEDTEISFTQISAEVSN